MSHHRPKLENIPITEMLKMAGFEDEPTVIEDCSVGMLNKVYKVSFSGGTNRIVLRVRTFLDPEYGQESVAERYAYYLIENNSINTPKLYFYCVDESILGYKFSVFECVEGPTMDVVLSDPAIEDAKKQKILKKLGRLLANIHRIKGPGFGTLTSQWNSSDQRREFWSKLFEAEYYRLQQYSWDTATKFKILIPYWMKQFEALPPCLGGPRLVHGDIHARNIILKNEVEPYLIDWEASRFRIAPYDLAQLSYLNLRDFPNGFANLLDGYCAEIPDNIDRGQLEEAIKLCEFFWHLRMGLFMLDFPPEDEAYFGAAEEHLANAQRFIDQSYESYKPDLDQPPQEP